MDRFGWDAAHHAPLGEMKRMLYAERIVNAYHQRQGAESWAKWAEDNEQTSAMLNRAMKLAEEQVNDGNS